MEGRPFWEAISRSAALQFRIRRFITTYTIARHRFLSSAIWIQPIILHLIPRSSILILSFHLRPGFPTVLFYFDFSAKLCMHSALMPCVLRALPILFYLTWPAENIESNLQPRWIKTFCNFATKSSQLLEIVLYHERTVSNAEVIQLRINGDDNNIWWNSNDWRQTDRSLFQIFRITVTKFSQDSQCIGGDRTRSLTNIRKNITTRTNLLSYFDLISQATKFRYLLDYRYSSLKYFYYVSHGVKLPPI